MKASQFKTSYAEIIKQAVQQASDERSTFDIEAIISDSGVEIRTIYMDVSELVLYVPFSVHKNSTQVLTEVITSLTYWAAGHDLNCALKQKTKAMKQKREKAQQRTAVSDFLSDYRL
jgi:hypothetical protein